MEFRFEDGLPVLRRTPSAIAALLDGLPEPWIHASEGPGSWSPYDVVGHLIHGERTDWVPRIEHIIAHGDAVPFPPFDREAMFTASRGKTLASLLAEFAAARQGSLARLETLGLTRADFSRRGRHPEFGAVTLGQHLATWVAHDLSHIAQVARVMGRQYSDAVGPWSKYLPMLEPRA